MEVKRPFAVIMPVKICYRLKRYFVRVDSPQTAAVYLRVIKRKSAESLPTLGVPAE
jgi:hypothetical protein